MFLLQSWYTVLAMCGCLQWWDSASFLNSPSSFLFESMNICLIPFLSSPKHTLSSVSILLTWMDGAFQFTSALEKKKKRSLSSRPSRAINTQQIKGQPTRHTYIFYLSKTRADRWLEVECFCLMSTMREKKKRDVFLNVTLQVKHSQPPYLAVPLS